MKKWREMKGLWSELNGDEKEAYLKELRLYVWAKNEKQKASLKASSQ